MADHNDFGKIGEDIAVDYLIEKGYEVLCRNFRYLKAEIDIIARFQDQIIIIEVKARKNVYFGNPEEAVNEKKRKLLIQAADYYLNKESLTEDIRFDIISVINKNKVYEIIHIENAFDSIH